MADNFGLRIGVEGEKDFKNALRDINRNFKVLGSEMKLVTAQFDRQDQSIEALTARNGVLTKSVDAQKDKISTLEAALRNAAESFGETDRRTQNWQIQLNNAKSALALKTKQLAKLNDQYFELVQISKSLQGSLPVCSVTCERISYLLNDEAFNIDEFDYTGDPKAGLNQILSGTPFSAGIVDFTETCTMKINQEVTRRAALKQYIAILGGEIEYDGYQINIRKHRGSSIYQPVMDSKNVTDVSVSHDSRENASSYNISFFKLLNLAVGDNVRIVFRPLGIDVKTRIISLEYNPFYRYNIQVEVGRYKPSISDTFYRIENSMNKVESSLNDVGSSVNGLQYQMDQLGVSYTIVKNLTIDETMIHVTYEVEKGDTHQYFADYSYTSDSNGRITSITLEEIFSELLLKEVSTLTVDAARFDIVYADGETASYNYSTDSSGRITGIEKVVEG